MKGKTNQNNPHNQQNTTKKHHNKRPFTKEQKNNKQKQKQLKTTKITQLKKTKNKDMGPGWKYKEGHSFKVRYNAVQDSKYTLYFNSIPRYHFLLKII